MLFAIIVSSVVAVNFTKGKIKTQAADYSVSGGSLVYDFDTASQMQNFSLYGEFGALPYWQDGKVYFRSLEEQKLILNNYTFSEVEVVCEVSTLTNGGKFDGGLYIQASSAGNGMDKINAYSINIEHAMNAATYVVKVHRFDQAWGGIKVEKAGLTLLGTTVKLKAVVKSGTLYVFADDMENPIINLNIGTSVGQIGIRSFYTPQSIDNLVITSPSLTVDKVELEAEKNIAQNKVDSGNYISSSVSALNSAINLANSANTAVLVQEALDALKNANANAIVKKTFAELTTLLESANKITDSSKYTTNSYNTLVAERTSASSLTASSSQDAISTRYYYLDRALTELIPLI